MFSIGKILYESIGFANERLFFINWKTIRGNEKDSINFQRDYQNE